MKKTKIRSPLKQVIGKCFIKTKNLVFCTFLLYGTIGGDYHFYLIFFGTYLHSSLELIDKTIASNLNTKVLLLYSVVAPLAGFVADRFGIVKTLKFALASLIILGAINAWCLHQSIFYPGLWFAIAFTQAFFHLPGYVYVFQKFKVEERYQCVSFGHSMGSVLLSGSAPWMSLWLFQTTQLSASPLIYLIFLAILGSAVLWFYDKKI